MSVGIGIVGSGFMGRTYAEAITTQVPDARVVAVAGGTRAPALAADYGIELEESPEALFARADVDAVMLCTPHSAHLPHTVAAAAAGKHVLCEKPMGRTVAECDEMIAACRRAGVLLAINKLTRFRDSPANARRLLDEGAIGEPRMLRAIVSYAGLEENTPALQEGAVDWYLDPAEGSVYLDWGSHVCDMLRWLSGSEAVTAFGQFRSFTRGGKPEQSGTAEYAFESGAIAQVLMSSEVPPPGLDMARYVVVGSKGILDCDAYGKLLLGRGDSWEVVYEQPPIDFVRNPNDPYRLKGWAVQVQDFVDCITSGDGRLPLVTGEDGRAAVEMVAATELSHRTGTVVTLPLETPPG